MTENDRTALSWIAGYFAGVGILSSAKRRILVAIPMFDDEVRQLFEERWTNESMNTRGKFVISGENARKFLLDIEPFVHLSTKMAIRTVLADAVRK